MNVQSCKKDSQRSHQILWFYTWGNVTQAINHSSRNTQRFIPQAPTMYKILTMHSNKILSFMAQSPYIRIIFPWIFLKSMYVSYQEMAREKYVPKCRSRQTSSTKSKTADFEGHSYPSLPLLCENSIGNNRYDWVPTKLHLQKICMLDLAHGLYLADPCLSGSQFHTDLFNLQISSWP